MLALTPLVALRASWQLLSKRPLATLGVSAALLTSWLTVCCGLGALVAPWLTCELLALQLASAQRGTGQRSALWLLAGGAQFWGLLALGTLALPLLLALTLDGGGLLSVEAALSERLLAASWWALVAAALGLTLLVHFEHAPALVLERNLSWATALFASARLSAEAGLLRHWLTSIAARALPLLVLVATCALARLPAVRMRGLEPVLLLLALPLLVSSVALGRGMITAVYVAHTQPADARWRQPLRARALLREWLLLALPALVLAGPLALSAALLRPAELAPGTLPDGGDDVLLAVAVGASPQEVELPASTLRLLIEPQHIALVARDGGGAGALPLAGAPIARVRVLGAAAVPHVAGATENAAANVVDVHATHAPFAIEIRLADGTSYITAVDAQGVRLDDTFARRLALLLPPGTSALLLLCWAWLASWLSRALPRLASHYLGGDAAAFTAYARASSLWLLLPALVSLTLGLGAWLR